MSDAPGLAMEPVITRPESERAIFVVRVYQHLALAVAAFIVFEVLLFYTGIARRLDDYFFVDGGPWLLMLGGIMVVSWLATNAAHDYLNPSRQYLGLFGMAGAEALIFAPFLSFVFRTDGSGSVWTAAVITAVGFAALTGVGWYTRADLSWIRPVVIWGFTCALLLIVFALLFGWNLGVWFSVGMIALAGLSILYTTQRIVRTYPTEAYVGAALQLFVSLMTLFWYVLSIVRR